jgi:branched-chain amino acid transport system permease protein
MKSIAERADVDLRLRRPSAVASLAGSLWPIVIGLVIAWFLQQVVAPVIGPFKAKLLLDIGIAIVAAGSLNIVNGFGGQFSIGHAGFMMIGGYAAAWLTYYGSIQLWGSADVHGDLLGSGDMLFLGACVLAGVVAAAAGFIVGMPSLRLRGDYLAIVTLGFGEIVRVLVQRTSDQLDVEGAQKAGLGSTITRLGGSLGLDGVPTYTRIFYVYMFVAILLVAAYRLKISSKGRALLAVRENEIAAEAIGVNTSRVKVTAFVMAAFFAGIGGALFAHELGTALNARELGFQKSIDLVIIVVIGGMGSITGVVTAATILTILPEAFREFDQYRMPVYALALIVVMIVRPQGLFGIHELWEMAWWKRIAAKLRGPKPPLAIAREVGDDYASVMSTVESKPPPDDYNPSGRPKQDRSADKEVAGEIGGKNGKS